MPLLGGETLPGKGLRQRQELLLSQTITWANVCRTMNAGIDPLAPDMRLAIEIVEVREGDPTP